MAAEPWYPDFSDVEERLVRELIEDMLGGPLTWEVVDMPFLAGDPYVFYDGPEMRFHLRGATLRIPSKLARRLHAPLDEIFYPAVRELRHMLLQLAMRLNAVERGGYD